MSGIRVLFDKEFCKRGTQPHALLSCVYRWAVAVIDLLTCSKNATKITFRYTFAVIKEGTNDVNPPNNNISMKNILLLENNCVTGDWKTSAT